MNRRIKLLAEQARTEANDLVCSDTWTWNEWHDCFNKKFAELIVKECADYISETATIETLLGERLKEHFGVEE